MITSDITIRNIIIIISIIIIIIFENKKRCGDYILFMLESKYANIIYKF